MANGEKKVMVLFNDEALLQARSYKTKESVGIKKVRRSVPASLNTKAHKNLLTECRLPRDWAIPAVTIDAASKRSAFNIQLEVKGMYG